MTISLPFPLTIYKAWIRQNRTGYLTKSKDYLNYIDAVHLDLLRQAFKIKEGAPYAVEIFLHSSSWMTKTKKIAKRDVDNKLKCLIDAIVKHCENTGIAWDDSMIVELFVKKIYDKSQERAVVRFTECSFP